MILYLDTSALVKLYVREAGSDLVRAVADNSAVITTSKVAYAEARAALARGNRDGALHEKDYHLAVNAFNRDWDRYLAVEVSDFLIRLAGDLAEKYRLRGFDAIHLASILTVKRQVNEPLVVACWDVRLWEAVQTCALDTVPQARPR